MATLVIQSGHYGRTSGATGGPGERELMIRYARAAKALVDRVDGWTAKIIDADEPSSSYRGDAFVALHADATSSSSARGGSVGYRSASGRELAHDWKAAWRAEVGDNVGPFRSDNYTTNLSGYYGTRRAVEVGNTRCCIVEHGFMTNAQERAFLESDDAVAAAARAVCKAVTGRIPGGDTPPPIQPPTILEDAMGIIGLEKGMGGAKGDAPEDERARVACLQHLLQVIRPDALPKFGPDADFGDETAEWLGVVLGSSRPDGRVHGVDAAKIYELAAGAVADRRIAKALEGVGGRGPIELGDLPKHSHAIPMFGGRWHYTGRELHDVDPTKAP